jgi:DNA polymerase-1
VKNVWELYNKYWLPFGEILTDIERTGIRVNMDHMRKIEEEAKFDLLKKEEYFLNFLASFQDGKNIDHFNPSSALQLQQLLFAPCVIKRPEKDQKNQDDREPKSKEDQELSANAEEFSENAYEPKSEAVRA